MHLEFKIRDTNSTFYKKKYSIKKTIKYFMIASGGYKTRGKSGRGGAGWQCSGPGGAGH